MPRFQTRLPRPVDRRYWLRNCTGYSVYSAEGRVGVVDEVVEVDGAPAHLVVRSGLFRSSVHAIDAVEIAEIVPRKMRVIMRGKACDDDDAPQPRTGVGGGAHCNPRGV
jgi:hypothetical protein